MKSASSPISLVLLGALLIMTGGGDGLPERRSDAAPKPPRKQASTDSARVEAAYAFLSREHDRFHRDFIVYDDRDSGAIHFFPSGWMGDLVGLGKAEAQGVLDDACTVQPYRGTTCIKLTYSQALAQRGTEGWVGIYWQFPDANWGAHPGYDLRRYVRKNEEVRLVFAARGEHGGEQAEFKSGGVNRPKGNLPYQDSFRLISTGVVRLTRKWQRFSLSLRGADLSSVIGGFCWTTNRPSNPRGCTIYLDEIRVQFGPQGKGSAVRLKEPRFVRSYVPRQAGEPDQYFRNVCYMYDNALAILALVARGHRADLSRARLLADALVYAQDHDRHFTDGRLRNAYSCGDLGDPALKGAARLPGWWNSARQKWYEDEYAVSSDCGNIAWVMLALCSYWEKADRRAGSPYLKAARRLGQWVHKHAYSTDRMGGYTGGLEGWEKSKAEPRGQRKVTWKSTEHNIDLYAAFTRLADATGDPVWRTRAQHARRFVERMWDVKEGHFWTGTGPDGLTINRDPIPLDIHPWALLAFRDARRYGPAIDWALKHCWVKRCPRDPKASGFDFNTDLDGVWWEGTAQMQVALRLLGRRDEAAAVLKALRTGAEDVKPRGAVFASSRDQLTTGFHKDWGDWVYYRRPHVGATCWYLFAELGWNPYWARPVQVLKP